MNPEQAWSGRSPAIDHFRIFGCIAYAHVPDEKRKKLDDKSEKCVFLDFSETSKAYKLFNPQIEKIVINRDVFDEGTIWYWNMQQPTPVLFENELEKLTLIPKIHRIMLLQPLKLHQQLVKFSSSFVRN